MTRDPAPLMDRFRLDDRVAIVTGASSGLGAAFAVAMAEAGAGVVLAARRADRLRETQVLVEDLGRRVLAIETDATIPEQRRALVDQTLSQLGRLDVLVNNARCRDRNPGADGDARAVHERHGSERAWLLLDGASLRSGYGAREQHRQHRKPPGPGDRRAATSRIFGKQSSLIGLTRDLAQQWTNRRGMRVKALAPGFFPSAMTDHYQPCYLARQVERLSVGRLGETSELTAGVHFIASEVGT